jgi:hypothetical protein
LWALWQFGWKRAALLVNHYANYPPQGDKGDAEGRRGKEEDEPRHVELMMSLAYRVVYFARLKVDDLRVLAGVVESQ